MTPLVRNIYRKYCGKWQKNAPEEQYLLLTILFCYLEFNFFVNTRTRFSLRDKRLFEIIEVEITRVYKVKYKDDSVISIHEFNGVIFKNR